MRRVLVVGGGSGIGAGIAAAFAAAGDAVTVAGIDATAVVSVAVQLGSGAVAAEVGVTDEGSVGALFGGFGPFDVVINSAGIYPNAPVAEMSLAQWREVHAINVDGAFLVGRAAARSMTAGGIRGRIITISSGASTSARVGAAHYCSSKAAVDMLTRVLALELGPAGITVNAVAPGLIDVERLADLTPEYKSVLVAGQPLQRIGRPSDIAAACVYLASDAAEWVTGVILPVDGGFAAGRPLPFAGAATD